MFSLPKETIKHLYELTGRVTPLKQDCGLLCQKVCCSEWETGVGVYLLPGEEEMFGPEDASWLQFEDHSPEDYDIYPGFGRPLRFVRCHGSCPRDRRPFECRTFPLVPLIADSEPKDRGRHSGDYAFELAFNPEGILICPLVQSGDLSLLDREFVNACRQAYLVLMQFSVMRDYFRWASENYWRQEQEPWMRLFR